MAAERLGQVRERIAQAACQAGRAAEAITLVAVSKTFDAAAIEPLLQAGHRQFGENRVQEAQAKWPGLRERFGDVALHLIGPLQTNKVRDAVALFDAIHSVDREKLAAGLAREMRRQGRRLTLFVQVNTGGEPQKAGISTAEATDFVRRCEAAHGLAIDGLMCIPPAEDDPAPHFETLRQLAARLGLTSLSMGMTGDFEPAIAHGATHIRVGSALFSCR